MGMSVCDITMQSSCENERKCKLLKKTLVHLCFIVMHFWDRRNCNKEIKQPGIKQINSIYLVGELVTSYDVQGFPTVSKEINGK